MFKVKFDEAELRKWFSDEPDVQLDGFAAAISDNLFEDHIRSSNLAGVSLSGDGPRPFLPFAKEWVYTEHGSLGAPDANGKGEGELFDTIVVPGIIQRVRDPFRLLRATFDRVRPGGTLILSVPLRDIAGESHREPDRNKRIYTASRLLLEMQAAVGFSAYRLRFAKEYGGAGTGTGHRPADAPAAPPSSLIMVFEREPGRMFHPDIERTPVDRSYEVAARSEEEGAMAVATGAILSPGLDPAAVERVCVLKPDHIGDFVMALPVFAEIRDLFPAAEITCVCGSWNVPLATDLGFFDRVVACDYFKQDERRGGLADSDKALALQRLGDELSGKEFDLAIDLRVPQDSRSLLLALRARFRAGIGRADDFRFLDVALPPLDAFSTRLSVDPEAETIHVAPSHFRGRGVVSTTPSLMVLAPAESDGEFVFGPYMPLRRGAYRLSFLLSTLELPRFGGEGAAASPVRVRADVAIQEIGQRAADLQITRDGADRTLEFELFADSEKVEFRVALAPGQEKATLLFAGVKLESRSGRPPIRHMALGQIHMKEQMSLLLALVRTRLFDRAIDPATIRRRLHVAAADGAAPPFFALVPFSNSALRDWPFSGYEALAQLILEQTDARVRLIGAPSHQEQLDVLVADLSGRFPDRIVNHAGRPWAEVYADLAHAEAVVTNNSGLAHVAGMLGARVLALYSASHQVMEWGALGPWVTTLQARLPCGQCGFDTLAECMHGVRCMHLITAPTVIGELRRIAPRSFSGVAGQPSAERASAVAGPKLFRSPDR